MLTLFSRSFDTSHSDRAVISCSSHPLLYLNKNKVCFQSVSFTHRKQWCLLAVNSEHSSRSKRCRSLNRTISYPDLLRSLGFGPREIWEGSGTKTVLHSISSQIGRSEYRGTSLSSAEAPVSERKKRVRKRWREKTGTRGAFPVCFNFSLLPASARFYPARPGRKKVWTMTRTRPSKKEWRSGLGSN